MASAAQYHVPTDELRQTVKILYSAGVAEDNIARHIGLKSPKTLRKHYRQELDSGKVFLGELAIKALVEEVTSGRSGMPKVTAAIWLTKNNLGWKDKVERSGDGDTNVTIAAGSKIVVLPSNGREQIAQQRLLARRPPMIEATAVEVDND